jgi:hypothetical protein
MENFVSIALLLIVKVANPPQSLPARLPLIQPEALQPSVQPLGFTAETAQQQGFPA